VIRSDAANEIVRNRESAVHNGHARLPSALAVHARARTAGVVGLRIAGKTGTADADDAVYASFIGTALDRELRLVVLVGLESRRENFTGPSAAARVFARIARRIGDARGDR